MARAIWSGSLNFGLVTVPVELFSATSDRTPKFHQLQRGTGDRVRVQRVNERTGEQVAFKDIVKGYEFDDGQYVVFTQDELDEIAPGRSKAIEISGFVDLEQVEPIFFATTYYLGPKGEEYGRVYALLREALEKTHRAGVASFVMRGRQYLTAIKAEKQVLVLHTMHYADEIRDPVREIPALPGEVVVNERELGAARQLIETLGVAWDPHEYRDEYRARLDELIEAKQHGEGLVSTQPPPSATNVVDLMDALERSIALGRRADPRMAAESAAGPDSAAGTERAESDDAQQAAEGGGASGDQSAGAEVVPAKPRKGTRGKAASPAAESDRPAGKRAAAKSAGPGGKKTSASRPRAEDLSALSKAELYARATDLDIPGRSTMSRDRLREAVEQAVRARARRGATVA
ncbi:MAG: Ku protein [Actinocrinis sp.]